MLEFGVLEAENNLGALLDRVQSGEEILITRHGRPIARLVPNDPAIDRTEATAAAARIRARSVALHGHAFDWDLLKQDRDLHRP